MDNQSTSFFTLLFVLGLFTGANGYAQQPIADAHTTGQYTAMANAGDKQAFSIYPAVVSSSASLLVNAEREGWANLEIKGVCGETLLSQQMAVDKGFNKIPVFFISQLDRGVHTAVLRVEEHTYFSELIKE